MRTGTRKPDWLPTPSQELLLQAALLPGDQAVRAWEQWESGVVFETLDFTSRQLVPLLYCNLLTHGIDHPLMERFKGIHRFTWYKNQLMLNNTAVRLRSFHDAGIVTMILKGAALVSLHYDTYGLRPMNDVDVLVHTDKALAAMSLLEELDYTTVALQPEHAKAFLHSLEYKDQDGNRLDLHWNVLPECRQADADDGFWSNAVTAEINEVRTCALSPTDQLLHVCVHGARGRPVLRLIWIADAMTILNSSTSIDWDRLVLFGQTRRLTLPLRETLGYLHKSLDAPIPATVLQSMHETPVSRAERIEYRVTSVRGEGILARVLELFWMNYQWYKQSSDGASLQHTRLGFARFLQRYWEISHLWKVPFCGAGEITRRIWNSILRSKNVTK